MTRYALIIACLLAQPAYAQVDDPPVQLRSAPVVFKHPRLRGLRYFGCHITYPARHPIQAAYNTTYPVRHPLKTGKWMEQSGFNGLLAGAGSLGCVASPFVTGALVR